MAHLPNIETSSQIIEEDESGTERLEVAVNFGKKKRALRKRAILTPVEECSSSPRFGSGRKAPVVEDKNVRAFLTCIMYCLMQSDSKLPS